MIYKGLDRSEAKTTLGAYNSVQPTKNPFCCQSSEQKLCLGISLMESKIRDNK